MSNSLAISAKNKDIIFRIYLKELEKQIFIAHDIVNNDEASINQILLNKSVLKLEEKSKALFGRQ